jgi:hypothetical protein
MKSKSILKICGYQFNVEFWHNFINLFKFRIEKTPTMENTYYVNVGMVAALNAVKKTLSIYEDGMSQKDVTDMITEIEQQMSVREVEMILENRA